MGETGRRREPEPDQRRGVVDVDRRVDQRDDGLDSGGLGAGDDAGQRVAIVPVVELEPERQARLGGGDVLDARGRVDGHDEQAAGPRGAVGHRELAIRVDRPLEAHRADHDRGRDRGAEDRRLGPDRGDVDEDARAQPSPAEGRLVVALETVSRTGTDPLVGRGADDIAGDLAVVAWR